MAPVQNNPQIQNPNLRPLVEQNPFGLPSGLPSGSTVVTPSSRVNQQAQIQYSQDQAARLGQLQQGNLQGASQAAQASFMSPAQYQRRYPNQPPPLPSVHSGNPHASGTELVLALQNQASIMGILNEYRNSSPELNQYLNKPGVSKLFIIFAAMILSGRNKIDKDFQRIANLAPTDKNVTGDPDNELLMVSLTQDIRHQQQTTEMATNTLKSKHDTEDAALKKISS